jgi:hypothetical protein
VVVTTDEFLLAVRDVFETDELVRPLEAERKPEPWRAV